MTTTTTTQTIKSPIKAIRSKCLDCCGNQPSEVRLCQIKNCAIYPYRFGNNPNRKGIGGSFAKKADSKDD